MFAIIPAAGKSRRMGRPKLLLPVGGRTVLERVVDALGAAGVDAVLVVTGGEPPELAAQARGAGAHVLLLERETADMRQTVEQGLAWIERTYRPTAVDAWLLAPADHPTLDPEVVRRLLGAWRSDPEASVVVPVHEGRRGHPVLIGWRHVEGVRAFPPGLGLDAYLRQHAAQTLLLPVGSPGVLLDLDTPEDYARLTGGADPVS